jgi:uncharacterized membrane protein
MRDLGAFTAEAVNRRGEVAGSRDGRALVWRAGLITDLGPGEAFDLDDAGRVVGTSGGQAVVWERGRMRTLPGLGGPARALGVSGDGQIVGESATASGDSHAVIWR